MEWQLLAIWAVVILAVLWFRRDEKRRRADADLARAARYYAHAPAYRHVSPQMQMLPPTRRTGGLSPAQRALFKRLEL